MSDSVCTCTKSEWATESRGNYSRAAIRVHAIRQLVKVTAVTLDTAALVAVGDMQEAARHGLVWRRHPSCAACLQSDMRRWGAGPFGMLRTRVEQRACVCARVCVCTNMSLAQVCRIEPHCAWDVWLAPTRLGRVAFDHLSDRSNNRLNQ